MSKSTHTERAISPAVGTVTLVALTVVLVAVATSFVGATPLDSSPSRPIMVSATADGTGTVTIEHEAGPPIDFERASLDVTVDGQSLERQPPVPFFSTAGFEPGPTGAFNSATDGRLTVGETASFTVAGTNAPAIEPGATVTVRVGRDDRVLATAETSVEGGSGDGDER